MPFPKILKSQTTIRFQDCDPYSHLNNAQYIDYFMNAREDQILENYNIDIYGLARTEGIAWVVAQNQIAYLQPALLMEKVWISTRVIAFSGKMITVEFQMWDSGEQVLKALMWTRFAHVDLRSGKSIPHAEAYHALFSEVLSPVDTDSFDQRVKSVRDGAGSATAEASADAVRK